MSALRIALLTASLSRRAGGLFQSVRRSAQALHEAGVEVEVIGLRDADTEADLAAWSPLKPIVMDTVGPARFGYARGLKSTLLEGQFDIVHQHGIWQGISIATNGWRQATGRPVMISPRGMLDPWAVRHSGLKKRIAGALFEHKNLREAACIHALTTSEAEAVRAYGLENPIAIIPNGTSIPDLVDETCRPPWDQQDDRRALLFLGRIHAKKGIIELLEGWADLKLNQPHHNRAWHLVIAGWDDGGHLGVVRQAVTDLGLEEDVTFPGPLHGETKDAAYRCASAFILPSHSEGLPMAVLEAWSYHLPVLMTSECNIPEGFEHDAAKEIHRDTPRLSAQLDAFFGSSDKVHSRIGEAGFKLVEAKFAWTTLAARHCEVYEWMQHGDSRGEWPEALLRQAPRNLAEEAQS